MSKAKKILIGLAIGSLVTGAGFLALFLSGVSVLGLPAVLVADVALSGAMVSSSIFTGVTASGITGVINKNKWKKRSAKAFHQMDRLQNSKKREKQKTQKHIAKISKRFTRDNLKLAMINRSSLVSRRHVFTCNQKQNRLRNKIEAFTYARDNLNTRISEKKRPLDGMRVSMAGRRITKLGKKLASAERNTKPVSIKYNWTRSVKNPYTNALILDHRTEIGCLKLRTLEEFKALAAAQQLNKSVGNAVMIKYAVESDLLSPYACMSDAKKMEKAEVILLKEACLVAKEEKTSVFPIEVVRYDLKTGKSTVRKLHSLQEVEKEIEVLNAVTQSDLKSKYINRDYAERASVEELGEEVTAE